MRRTSPRLTTAGVRAGFLLLEEWLAVPRDMGGKPSESPQKIAGMVLLFPNVSDAAFYEACAKLCRTQEFFPRPVSFRKALMGDPETQGELAWQAVREAMRRIGGQASLFASDLGGDGAALWAVSRLGWPELCAVEAADLNFRRVEFLRLYAAAFEAGMAVERIAGPTELRNLASGVAPDRPELMGRSAFQDLPELGHKALPFRGEGPAALPARAGEAGASETWDDLKRRVRTKVYGSPEVAQRIIQEAIEERDDSIETYERKQAAAVAHLAARRAMRALPGDAAP